MNTVAKWIAILWSIFCLAGFLYGVSSVSSAIDPKNQYETAGGGLGIMIGAVGWVVFWAVITLPATVVYLLTKNKRSELSKPSLLEHGHFCPTCNEWRAYRTKPTFCTVCGNKL